MGNFSNIIEAAILLLITFLIGCIVGWFLRAKIFKRRQKEDEPKEDMPKTTIAPVMAAVQSTAPTAKPQAIKPKPVPSAPKPKIVKSSVSTPKPKTEPKPKTPPKPISSSPRKAAIAEVAKTTAPTHKPAGLTKPRDGKKDDLKKIKGVGPKLEGTLNGLGIYHFDQISKWTQKEIDWVDDFLSFKGRIDRDQWISQAKKLS